MHLFFWLLLLSISTSLQIYGPFVKVGQVNIASLTLWPWILIPCLVSLILLVFYKPMMFLLYKILLPRTSHLQSPLKDVPVVIENYHEQTQQSMMKQNDDQS